MNAQAETHIPIHCTGLHGVYYDCSCGYRTGSWRDKDQQAAEHAASREYARHVAVRALEADEARERAAGLL